MSERTKNVICALIAAVISTGLFYIIYRIEQIGSNSKNHITVGFVYDGDGSTPYTANFMQAAAQLSAELGDKVTVLERFNVPTESVENTFTELVDQGCDIIFSNSYDYGDVSKRMAEKYGDVQFCQATCSNANASPVLANYHNFMGEIYQGRYICGMIAGRKLMEMISKGEITEGQAVLGYVAAFPVPEVISGYTAFFLGARSQCPAVVMKVKYTNTWSDYATENKAAKELISEGCVIISQHSDTIGPAIACENADMPYRVYHIGYNQDMMNVAPYSTLCGTRIDWAPYVVGAVRAVLDKDEIESEVDGNVNGNDISGGFKEGWVRMLGINEVATAEGTSEMVETATEDMIRGRTEVFKGEYIGVDPNDPTDTYDLSVEYPENEKSSAPTFHYVLKDVITVLE